MRELKFRAWDKSQNYMAYQGNPDLETLSSFMFHFGEDIVMESTGIKDYEDNDIFEGDIISPISQTGGSYIVKYEDGGFVLYSKFGLWGHISKLRPVCDKYYVKATVIGNIYENPEMWQSS